MDGFVVIIVIAICITVYNIVKLLSSENSKPMSKSDLLNAELKRLHGELGTYNSPPSWISDQIKSLNEKIMQLEDENEKDS